MTRHLRLAILTLLLATLPAAAARAQTSADTPPATPTSAAAAPRAVVDQPVVDKGRVPVGDPVNADFTIQNEGEGTLQILQVHPACGCTVADFDKEIAPGGSGTVHATVHTDNMSGPIAKSITVYTNDQSSPRLQLTIKADIRQFLIAQPGYARFTSMVHGDREHDSRQVLWAEGMDGLKVLGVEAPQPWVHTDFHEATADERSEDGQGSQWIIDIKVDKDAPVGPIADYVDVKTNHPKQPVLQIPVSGFVRPLVAVTPPAVKFGDVDPSKGQTWGVLLRNFGSDPLEIASSQSTVPGLEVKIEPIKQGQQYKVVLTPTDTMAEGAFDGRVEIRTNLPEEPAIAIDLTGNVVSTKAGG